MTGMSIIERAQQEAVRRLLNGQHSRTFYDGATFAATITPEQVEAAARAAHDAQVGAGSWDRYDTWTHNTDAVREEHRERIRAALTAAGFQVDE